MNVEVIKNGERHLFQAEPGSNLMGVLLETEMMPGTECAGRGVCGKCRVRVRSGETTPLASNGHQARQDAGWILACQNLIKGDLVIEVPSSTDAVGRKVRLHQMRQTYPVADAPVQKRFLALPKPSLTDQRPDMERVLEEAGDCGGVSLLLLRHLPKTLRDSDFNVTAVLAENRLIDVEPGDTREEGYGFVFDIGTTTIAGYLIKLHSGDVLGVDGKANPQRALGADVLSRVASIAERFDNLETLRSLTLAAITQSIRSLLEQRRITASSVYSVVIVGNTTMTHLFLGLDPRNLALSPFIPCCRRRTVLTGAELELPMHPEGEVSVLPNSAGYLGSDILSVVLSTEMHAQEGYSLAVDIGTNAEIVLSGKGRILACAAAAGPAFEGAHIHNGMRAGDGAIEGVRIEGGGIILKTIGDTPPQGICGSGLIDAAVALLRGGLLDQRGRLAEEEKDAPASSLKSRIRVRGGMREFVLLFVGEQGSGQDIVITQKDIRELQLAKGAVAAGIRVLTEEMGINAAHIDRVFLAGAFGNYINKEHAVALGMFPDITAGVISSVGNAAGEGARRCLLSIAQRKTIDRLSTSVQPIELSAHPAFNTNFLRELNFPPVGIRQPERT